MKVSKYASRALILSIGFSIVFVEIAALVVAGKLTPLDLYIIGIVQGPESPFLTSLAKGLSLVGSARLAFGLTFVIMGLLYYLLRHRMELVLFLWVGLGSYALNMSLKSLVGRERPHIHQLIDQAGFSFPSGHSMAAFSLYGVITYILWIHLKARAGRSLVILTAVLMTLGIGWSRVYLGAHYPSDVIGGYVASCAWLMLSIAMYSVYRSHQKRKKHPL